MTENSNNESGSDNLIQMIGKVYGFLLIIIFEFARYKPKIKDSVIRNFIAKTAVTLHGIEQLWNIHDYQDCWVLYRCLLDRLFTIEHLAKNNEFELFEDWSFYRQFTKNNEAYSDIKLRDEKSPEKLKQYVVGKERYNGYGGHYPNWKRPKAKDVAKEMGLDFLYKYGYDYGSFFVHPNAYDGSQDFFIITGLEPAPVFPKQYQLLSNSILVACMIAKSGMMYSDLHWHNLLWDFIFETIECLNNDGLSYKAIFLKIGMQGQDFVFSKPK